MRFRGDGQMKINVKCIGLNAYVVGWWTVTDVTSAHTTIIGKCMAWAAAASQNAAKQRVIDTASEYTCCSARIRYAEGATSKRGSSVVLTYGRNYGNSTGLLHSE